MIDPLTAFAAVKSAHSVIMKGIKVGKDLSSLSGYISKWAIGEANLDVKAEKKGSSISVSYTHLTLPTTLQV